MPADSRFVYPRSIQNDVADTLASCREMVPASERCVIDLVNRSLLHTFL